MCSFLAPFYGPHTRFLTLLQGTAHRATGSCSLQSESPRTDATHQGSKPRADDRRTVALPYRLARLLWLLRNAIGVACAGRVDQAAAPCHRLEAMETRANALC